MDRLQGALIWLLRKDRLPNVLLQHAPCREKRVNCRWHKITNQSAIATRAKSLGIKYQPSYHLPAATTRSYFLHSPSSANSGRNWSERYHLMNLRSPTSMLVRGV